MPQVVETQTRQTGLHRGPGELLRDGGQLKRIPWPAGGSPAWARPRSGVQDREYQLRSSVRPGRPCRPPCLVLARTEAMWGRLYAKLNVKSGRPALDMENAEVAEFAYTPGGWKYEPLRVIVRRVRVAAEEVRGDARSRLQGPGGVAPTRPGGLRLQLQLRARRQARDAAEIERWHRQRAHVEERIKEAKNGCGTIHLPMREATANRAWQAAVVVAHNLVSMLAAEVAPGNRRRLCERVADAVDEEDLRHAVARARPTPQPPARPALADQPAGTGGPPCPSGLRPARRRRLGDRSGRSASRRAASPRTRRGGAGCAGCRLLSRQGRASGVGPKPGTGTRILCTAGPGPRHLGMCGTRRRRTCRGWPARRVLLCRRQLPASCPGRTSSVTPSSAHRRGPSSPSSPSGGVWPGSVAKAHPRGGRGRARPPARLRAFHAAGRRPC